ncbi:syntaxin-binding 5 isoform X5 [Labeo rohita]|uniref:Syntaxin-binding 5 isoform X5 n=1 Tax=Labeo rohita TaxID=84645 RepID=A0A498NBV0_LABRO|nr:syntaxin-binding 5 isoform X5 [Labeo rohita]
MKKFNIRKVLTAVSSSSSAAAASPQSGNRENDMIQETLQSEHFQLCKFIALLHSLALSCSQTATSARITFCHLPFQSKWLYVGTERGNIHIVNVESFTLSGYVIMWNKAIELSSKTHPGPVVHISDNPMDEGKAIHSVAWHHEGKQFVCSHSDGTLTTWNVRAPAKPAQIITPHGKQPKDGKKPEPCKPILKVEYKTTRAGDPFMILCGGLSYDTVDFQEPYAVVVLLEKDLVVIDLAQIGYPIFENPYPLSIHESPVTCCEYFADCPAEVIPALYSVGSRQKRQGFSKKVLYKLKTAKVFEKPRGKEDKSSTEIVDEDPFAIQILSWCPESRVLCVAGVSAHVIVYRFSKQEVTTEVIQLLEVRMQCELNEVESPEGGGEQASAVSTPGTSSSPQTSLPQSHPSTSSNNSSDGLRDNVPCLKVRSSPLKQSPGYQVELLIQLVWVSGEPPQQITSLAVNSAYGLVAFGNGNGLAVVDYIQKTLLLNVSTAELYGSTDPHHRQPRSPRKTRQPSAGSGSPCNSDEDSKQKFFDKAKISRKINMIADQKDDARDNSFSRSRSSSVTSIDRESREIISSFYFCDSLSKKSETVAVPSLWVGTSLGSMLAIALTVPSTAEQRMQQPVGVSFCGPIVRLKGAILRMAQLEASGTLMPHVYESWYEPNAPEEEKERPRRRRPTSPPSSQENADCQYAVVCSEKQAKVVAMPSQNCIYEHNITETSFVLRADVVTMTTGLGIACFCANGHIMTLSLPSLRPLLDVNYLPLTDMRIARTFCFSNQGQALYLTSPTEIQRITYSQETCDNLQEMLGELFTPVETPEAPNRGFFKGLFGGGAQSLDREDLFGEVSAGKASRSLAQHIPGPGGMEGMKGAASGVVGELARARIALDERGQKLGELEERTAAMMASADSFSKHAHDVR